MARLSILIPCQGGAAEFDGTLVSVLQHRPADSEILVLHTQAYDDPYDLASEVTFVRHQAQGSSLVGLLQTGWKLASAPIVHVLACGLEVEENWAEPALEHFDDDEIAAVVPAVMDVPRSRLVSAGLRCTAGGSRRVLRDERMLLGGSGHLRAAIQGPTLAAGFYRRDVLEALEGWDPTAGDSLADVALALDLQSLQLRTVLEPASRVVLASDSRTSTSTSSLAQGRFAERLFWRNAGRVGLLQALAAHPFAVAADLLAAAPQAGGLPGLLGRALAWAELGSQRRYERRLQAAGQRLERTRATRGATLSLAAARKERIALPMAEPTTGRKAA
ncbi:MAG: glycosyltransferase family 2 protein [Pirellulaceae bacterium]